MPRALATAAAAAAALALAAPPARADPPAAEGRVETDAGQVELLSRPLRAGDRIDLPEGYLIVEESGPEDEQVGSFGVVAAESFAGSAAAGPAETADAAEPGDAPPPEAGAPACAGERAAYLAELWRASGIDVKDPPALLRGLEAGAAGPATGYYWFALATDPFRPLAYSSELRSRADALVKCVRAHGG